MKHENHAIGLITMPIGKAGMNPMLNMIRIMLHFNYRLFIVTGNEFTKESISNGNVSVCSLHYDYDVDNFRKPFNFFLMQLKISRNILKMRRKVDFLVFLYGSDLTLPLLLAKMLGKKVLLVTTGSSAEASRSIGSPYTKFLRIMEKVSYGMVDRIVVYSSHLVEEWNLEKHQNKISIAYRHYLNFEQFKVVKDCTERKMLIGFVGRLSQEKGVLEFVKAVPLILEKRPDLNFIIGGDGSLRDNIEKFVAKNNLNEKVKLVGWIPHEKLPDYLNELKLFVLPSYTEGLPNLILEAMACGAPVLATPVGAIPDVIKDGETGFIMEDNSPECIAKNIIRVLECPYLEKIVENARELVENEFTYEKAVEKWREIFEWI